jgi:hypothetical protein
MSCKGDKQGKDILDWLSVFMGMELNKMIVLALILA